MKHVTESHLTMDGLSKQFAIFTAGIFTYLSSMGTSSLCLLPRKYNDRTIDHWSIVNHTQNELWHE